MTTLKFIDLFAGIGGFHFAFGSEDVKGECVFASEWDEAARRTYRHFFEKSDPKLFEELPDGTTPRFAGDITKVDPTSIDDFDVLCGGFPCQPFSQAGLKKGMEEARGTLFFNILEILDKKRPAAYFLENVRGLASHKSGDKKTIDVIEQKLRGLGYSFGIFHVRASDYNVPQHRPRVFLIGFRDEEVANRFEAPAKKPLTTSLKDIIPGVDRDIAFTLRVGGRGSGLHDRRNWDTYSVNGKAVRITKEHGLKIQGFPDGLAFPDGENGVTDVQAMKQLGNSVAVPAIHAFALAIKQALAG